MEVETEAENEFNNDKGSKVQREIKGYWNGNEYFLFGLWLLGSITSPVIQVKQKSRHNKQNWVGGWDNKWQEWSQRLR